MARWYLVCQTCPVRVELPLRIKDRASAEWELKYHLWVYKGHDAKLTAQPKPKKLKAGTEEEPEIGPE